MFKGMSTLQYFQAAPVSFSCTSVLVQGPSLLLAYIIHGCGHIQVTLLSGQSTGIEWGTSHAKQLHS